MDRLGIGLVARGVAGEEEEVGPLLPHQELHQRIGAHGAAERRVEDVREAGATRRSSSPTRPLKISVSGASGCPAMASRSSRGRSAMKRLRPAATCSPKTAAASPSAGTVTSTSSYLWPRKLPVVWLSLIASRAPQTPGSSTTGSTKASGRRGSSARVRNTMGRARFVVAAAATVGALLAGEGAGCASRPRRDLDPRTLGAERSAVGLLGLERQPRAPGAGFLHHRVNEGWRQAPLLGARQENDGQVELRRRSGCNGRSHRQGDQDQSGGGKQPLRQKSSRSPTAFTFRSRPFSFWEKLRVIIELASPALKRPKVL